MSFYKELCGVYKAHSDVNALSHSSKKEYNGGMQMDLSKRPVRAETDDEQDDDEEGDEKEAKEEEEVKDEEEE